MPGAYLYELWTFEDYVVRALEADAHRSKQERRTVLAFPIDGLRNLIEKMLPVVKAPTKEDAIYTLNPLSATGTGILLPSSGVTAKAPMAALFHSRQAA